ncbi:hypothetical protein T472_0204335 [Youngiibacter fragilis 232.1]|uniref:Uncharacterized protein n=1 Tax=Youngiibacter fragilis 232.1 TaxID=994573 RepID=V7IAE2_9CLOT|nr:hypothetical protein T472_0204335 [Youngiibacter fragilis 232.1]
MVHSICKFKKYIPQTLGIRAFRVFGVIVYITQKASNSKDYFDKKDKKRADAKWITSTPHIQFFS